MCHWEEIFNFYVEDRNLQYMSGNLASRVCSLTAEVQEKEARRWERIERELHDRRAEIVESRSNARITNVIEQSPLIDIHYVLSIEWIIKQSDESILQRWVEKRVCRLKEDQGWWIVSDELLKMEGTDVSQSPAPMEWSEESPYIVQHPNEKRATYHRQKAVQYAERWWNDYNPKFRTFEQNDCTNYVSQCLWAGNAPMKYSSNRAKGWWYRFEPVNWSFSWSVAHSLRWYLPNSTSGLRAVEVSSADQLRPGDVICYDFNGDGRWQHNSFVVMMDQTGMPLVNAHTNNSQHRYWSYQDSYAWTEKTLYKFFRIADHF